MKKALQILFSPKGRLVMGAGALVIVLVLAYVAWDRFGSDRDGTVTVPELVTDGNGGGDSRVANSVGIAGESVGREGTGRLNFRLSKGQPGQDSFELLAPTEGSPLSLAEIEAVLNRLPSLESEASDQEAFRLPEAVLPPPRPGETVTEAFPPRPAVVGSPEVEDGPLRVLRFAPEGEIPLAPFLNVTFNQPMVPLATVESLSQADVPVTLTPALPGRWRWLGTNTLTFEYEGEIAARFPMATEYMAEIAAGTTSVTGNRLEETVTWRFQTPPVSLQQRYPEYGPQPLSPVIFVSFDQQIEAEAVLATIEVRANNRSVPIQLASATEIADDETVKRLSEAAGDERWLAFRPEAPLPTSARVEVTVGPNTPSAEGPLLSDETQSFEFFTYDPLQVGEAHCGWGRECPPLAPFFIEFNNPLDVEVFTPEWVKIEPALPGATVRAIGSQLQIEGPTRGNTRYHITIDGRLTDTFGQTLGQEEAVNIRVGSASPVLSGPNNPLVTLDPSAENPILSVYTINYRELDVRAYAVEPSDWRAYLDYRDRYYREDSEPLPPGQEVLNETITIEAEDDVFAEVPLELGTALNGETGHLVVIVQPPNMRHRDRYEKPVIQTWVQVTQIGLDAFADNEQLIAWATDLQDGNPLPDVTLELLPSGQSTRTDGDGLAQFELGSGGVLMARQGSDSALLSPNPYHWDERGWQAWSQPDELRWYVFDDRQMYQPGEEVHLKGWIRTVENGATGDVRLPASVGGSHRYEVMDAQGE